MPNSTTGAASTSEARATSSAVSRNWRWPPSLVLTALLTLCSTASCRLPGDLRALSRSTTQLTETLREEIPPTAESIRAAAVALKGDAEAREEQTTAIGDKVNQALGWIVSGLMVAVILLRGVVAKYAKKLLGANGGGGPTPPSSASSPPSSPGG